MDKLIELCDLIETISTEYIYILADVINKHTKENKCVITNDVIGKVLKNPKLYPSNLHIACDIVFDRNEDLAIAETYTFEDDIFLSFEGLTDKTIKIDVPCKYNIENCKNCKFVLNEGLIVYMKNCEGGKYQHKYDKSPEYIMGCENVSCHFGS